MSGVIGRRLIVAAAVVCAVAAGGGVAFALTPSPTAQQVAALEAPDGTQPSTDAQASVSAADSPSPSQPVAPSSSAPSSTPATKSSPTTGTTAPAQAGCDTGEKQREVEGYLAQIGTYGAMTVDGQQTPTECAAIRSFQTRFGISPANGRAGATTADVARRIATSLTAAEQAKCPTGSGTTACVDLTTQTVWVVKDGAVVFGPTVVRTGMRGYATPAGTYSVFNRSVKAWSTPYKVWLPYWQNFVNGIGFHATTTYIHNGSVGSHGCVNLLYGDAKTMYDTIGMGTTVQVVGRRPNT
jgi:lipoprotein-anchoring transpeptidase ErfK/SrfK